MKNGRYSWEGEGDKGFGGHKRPNRGASGKAASDKCLDFIDRNGDRERDIRVKTDQDPSIEFLVEEIVTDRNLGKTIVEEAFKKKRGSNWIVERRVQGVEVQIRALYLK